MKVFGFGAGARVLSKSLGHHILPQASKSDSKLSFLGRKQLKLPFIDSSTIFSMQHIVSNNTLLSSDKGTEISDYLLTDNLFALVSARPETNQAFMQEQVLTMYFKKYVISPELNEKSYLECQRDFSGEEDDTAGVQGDDREKVWQWVRRWAKV